MPIIPIPVLFPQDPVAQGRKSQEIGGLEVKYENQVEIDTENGKVTFVGSVVAKFDQTEIRCERLALDYRSYEGVAEGGVEIIDPEAFLTTETLRFNWRLKTGEASNVYANIGNMRMWAGNLSIEPMEWTMTRASATLSRRKHPDYKINSPKVRIYPGKYGIAKNVTFDLLGAHLGTAKEMRFDLDPRIDGFNLPSVTNKKGVGLGVSWNSSFLLSDSLVLGGNWGSFPSRAPGYGLDLTLMSSDPDKTYRKLKPQDDLKEQMGDGWFDNIGVRGPSQESRAVGSPRTIYSIATKWNTSTFGRTVVSNNVSKEFEGVFESAGKKAGFSFRGTARAQRIRPESATPFVDRLAFRGTALAPLIALSPTVGIQVRGDLFTTSSKRGDYSWLRGQAALVWSPSEQASVGVAYSSTSVHGTPDLLFDEPLYKQALHGRIDLLSGPYTIRFLVKANPSTGEFFDREYEVALVAESFEPFISVRQLPNDYRIGVRFRMQSFVSRMQRRKATRSPN